MAVFLISARPKYGRRDLNTTLSQIEERRPSGVRNREKREVLAIIIMIIIMIVK